MADASREPIDVIPVKIDDLKYMQASNVNVSNYVSVKLSSQQNYEIWKAQIVCLLESQQMRGIVDYQYDKPECKSAKIIRQYDKLLKGWIFGSLSEEVLKNVVRFESAREVWKELESFYAPFIISSTTDVHSREHLNNTETVRDLERENNDDTIRKKKLYNAIVEGSWWKVNDILKTHKGATTEAIGKNNNTMLHVAVEKHKNNVVEKLLSFTEVENDIEKKNSDGRTALHVAAKVGNIYAAKLLIEKRNELLTVLDLKAHTPLSVAYINMKLNIYVYLLEANTTYQQNAINKITPPNLNVLPNTYQQNAIKLIITAIFMKQYDLATKLLNMYSVLAKSDDSILMAIAVSFPTDLGFGEALIYPSSDGVYKKIIEGSSMVKHSHDVLYKWAEDIIWVMRSCENTSSSWLPKIVIILLAPIAILYPIYELIRLLILVLLQPFSVLYFLLWKVLAIVVPPIKKIQKKKNEYEAAKTIMSLICNQMGMLNSGYSGPILEAVRQGSYEVVDEILSRSPEAINCKNEEGHNVIQLAIINRSEKVYNLIYHKIKGTESYRTMTDSSKNNLVHLVGRLAPSFVIGRTTGAALQLQRELQWREEVKKLMLPTELIKENIYKETPEMVFTREHEDLVKEGEKWMKTTAESSSITAALIVTIVFAAAITVPGGSNQETGIPVFKKETAFTIFAIFDAISLFTASAALLVFLSVLTTRFAEKDFLVSLPRRLIFGLCALIVSTAAMIVAFGAILFLVFCDQRPWMWALITAGACLPIGVIFSLQFPLVVDLWFSTYVPIFVTTSNIMGIKHPTSSSTGAELRLDDKVRLNPLNKGFLYDFSVILA